MPGLIEEIPRITKSTETPACEARYRASMNSSSKSELSLNWIPDALPIFAFSISISILSSKPGRKVRGATSKRESVD